MTKTERAEATKRGIAKALLSLDNDAARAILTGRSTPGPWRIEQGENGLAIYAKPAYSIAWVFHEQEANARLIAAAPELLEALKALTELGERVPVFQLDDGKTSVKAVRLAGKFTTAMARARAVIAKAAQ